MATLARTRRAFTLMELLVVISLIGIMASMVFPVYARAREHARSSVCASNLHEIGMALQMYAQDWDGCYPPQANNLAPIAGLVGGGYAFRCPSARYSGLTGEELARAAGATQVERLPPRLRDDPPAYQIEQWEPVIADGVLLGVDYYYWAVLTNETEGEAAIVAEREANHLGGGNVLYASGRVKRLTTAEWEGLVPASARREEEDMATEEDLGGPNIAGRGGMRRGPSVRGGRR
jgi:prepilin-type N-terminal cleavage/methylation domain-containing protein